MTIYGWNTNVVYSTDKSDRRVMTAPPIESVLWGDCVGLFARRPDDAQGVWTEIAVLSPARARVLGEQLIEAAERREKRRGTRNIDGEVEES
jgi:hypothetical protein